jgi:hypothetical protein
VNGLLETLTFGPMMAATWHLACAQALTGYSEWLINVFEPFAAGGVLES